MSSDTPKNHDEAAIPTDNSLKWRSISIAAIFIVFIITALFLAGYLSSGSVYIQNSAEKDVSSSVLSADVSVQSEADDPLAECKAALKRANHYSSAMYMSKAGIYLQLCSEYGDKFSHKAAQYAIDNINADFKYNALKKAESCSMTMFMSKAAIYDHLTSTYGERFTEEEAQYAIDNLNANYKENALEKAKTYRKTINMSKPDIYQQLISPYGEKFTEEEAQFAIDNLD